MKRTLSAGLACLASVSVLMLSSGSPVFAANAMAEYVVKPGDTLLAIALKFDISVATLQAANNIDDPDNLQIGQKLAIPTAPGAAQAANRTHVIAAGDTLSGLSVKYGVSTDDLLRINHLTEKSLLQIGQEITIPGEAPPEAPAVPQVELIPLVPLVPVTPSTETSTPAVVAPTIVPIPADGNVEQLRAALLAYYNQARVANGLPALTYSVVLQQSAQAHADDCAALGRGSHVGSDGSRPSQRIAQAGFPGKITGENWAWARTAERAWEMWYTEEIPDGPHLKNILGPRYTEVGFGIAPSKGGYYMIANFGG